MGEVDFPVYRLISAAANSAKVRQELPFEGEKPQSTGCIHIDKGLSILAAFSWLDHPELLKRAPQVVLTLGMAKLHVLAQLRLDSLVDEWWSFLYELRVSDPYATSIISPKAPGTEHR